MKGLLYKDLTCLFGTQRANLILLSAICFVCFLFSGTSYFACLLVILIGNYTPSCVSFDEGAHFDAYARAMPVTPRQVVGCKYLLELASVSASAALVLALDLLLVPTPFADKQPIGITAAGLVGAVSVTLLLFSLHMPLLYRFGAVRARLWQTVLVAVLVLGPALVTTMLPASLNTPAAALHSLKAEASGASWGLWTVLLGLLALSLLLFGASCAVSIHIYRKKAL